MAVEMTLAELEAADTVELGHTDWIEIDQSMIDTFADATRDHQWIHVDHEKAAAGPFGTTIAHGFLTVSLLPELLGQLLTVPDSQMGVNYGMDRLRLTSPVPSGARIRGTGTITETQRKGDGLMVKADITVEIESQEKPALVGTFITLRY